jgi:uncharacterized protein (TIGR03435 family)
MTQETKRRMVRMTVAALAAAGLVSLHAQAPVPQDASPTFEVASIKRNTSGTGNITMQMAPGGRLNFVNMPVRALIVRAYQLQPFQVIGGPAWLANDRFDIIAKAEGDATPPQTNLMLRTLLADRFKLVVHTETRELPVYHLVKARPDGNLGPALKPAAVDCAAGRGRGGPPPPGAPGGAGPVPGPAGAAAGCMMMIGPGRITVGGQPLTAFVNSLATQVGRPVFDKTGLTGSFDFTLSYMAEAGRGGPVGPPPPGAPPLPPPDPDAPSLFTALQEQLGLKLEAERGPVEVIVIDSVEQPTED